MGLARLVFYVSDEEKAWWDMLAEKTHAPKIELLRKAINEYVEHHFPDIPRRPR